MSCRQCFELCVVTHRGSSPLLTGIAVDKNGLMYFVDATMIRKVDQNGIISTLLGANDLTAIRPLSCDTSMDVSQVCWLGGSAEKTRGDGTIDGDLSAP